MNKCDLCPNSRLEKGKIVCPWSICMLSKSELERIYKVFENLKR